MANSDYIPDPDSEFNIWQGKLVTVVEANATAWTIPADAVTGLKTVQTSWTTAFAKASVYQDRSTADVRAKTDARKVYEKRLRGFVNEYLASNSKIDNSQRESLGITVRTGQRTPVGVPASFPIGKIDFSIRCRHSIQIIDNDTNAKAKPVGVHGCEIWFKNGGEAPKGDNDFSYVATDTKNPYIVNFTTADVGKMVYYRFRWVNKRGQPGPWSSIESAVVGG
jgi:hypothetical protein